MSSRANTLPSLLPGDEYPLFVYGTLRRSQENYTLLRGYTLDEQPAWIEGYTLYVVNAYPAVSPGPHTVFGDLLRINPHVYDKVLARLDDFEQAACWPKIGTLQRHLCQVKTASGRGWAWLYQAAEARTLAAGQLVPSGDWIRYQMERIANTRLHRYSDAEMQKGMR